MYKKALSETEICTRYITPAIVEAGWDLHTQVRQEYSLSDGCIGVHGDMSKRGAAKRADYVLFYKANIPLAVVEAKRDKFNAADGIQQALDYAERLDVPFVFSSNGNSFVFHDKTAADGMVEKEIRPDEFPSPEALWAKYRQRRKLKDNTEKVYLQDYYEEAGKPPRYYQQTAINRAVHRIADGGKRLLLVMATGTGKTYTAFQIIWRLWKAGNKKRILFLADRDILINQTRVNDFRPFKEKMTRISSKEGTLDRGKEWIDPSYEIYLGLYQSLAGSDERQPAYRFLSPDFFDLIIVDECHRGSTERDSEWRKILEYFSGAVHLGMTATPKETEYASNTDYFGEPIYTYSLKQGIADGYLAPYKVIKVYIDIDVEGYRPNPGDRDRDGKEIPGRNYGSEEFDKNIVIDDRTKLVAKKISEYLRQSEQRWGKTIVFCVNTEHAALMRRALINENADLCGTNDNYVVRITGNDEARYTQLDNFQDVESTYPVIATTSRLLSTGVDIPTCRLIVIDREVGSMTEFKQIVGRGTRLHEDSGKNYFTLIDFRKATNHFADPDFDGAPVQIYEPKEDEPIVPPSISDYDSGMDDNLTDSTGGEGVVEQPVPIKKIYVDGVPVKIIHQRVQYLDEGGNLITKDIRIYSREKMLGKYATRDDFLTRWNAADRRQAVLDELEQAGVFLAELSAKADKDLDPFDLLCHIAYDRPMQTRRQRAAKARQSDVYTRYGEQARAVLEALLEKYQDGDMNSFEDIDTLQVQPLSEMGRPMEIFGFFGGVEKYQATVRELRDKLYAEVA